MKTIFLLLSILTILVVSGCSNGEKVEEPTVEKANGRIDTSPSSGTADPSVGERGAAGRSGK